MDDLLGSGSSILNGLRDQRSTLKVCAHEFYARAGLYVFGFYFGGKREKGVYEGKFPEKMKLKNCFLAQFPAFTLITMVLLFVCVLWEGESMFPGRWSSWVCFRPPLIRACLLIGTHSSGCLAVRNFWQSGASVRVLSLFWNQMN